MLFRSIQLDKPFHRFLLLDKESFPKNCNNIIVSHKFTAKDISFEWYHYKISSTDLKLESQITWPWHGLAVKGLRSKYLVIWDYTKISQAIPDHLPQCFHYPWTHHHHHHHQCQLPVWLKDHVILWIWIIAKVFFITSKWQNQAS